MSRTIDSIEDDIERTVRDISNIGMKADDEKKKAQEEAEKKIEDISEKSSVEINKLWQVMKRLKENKKDLRRQEVERKSYRRPIVRK